MLKYILMALSAFISVPLIAQQVVPLYPGEIPGSRPYNMHEDTMYTDAGFKGYRNVSIPTLAVYLPEKSMATGAAVIICPGGGYGYESYRVEGMNVAEAFVKKGIATFILKYRLPNDSIMIDKTIGPLQDAQQAIKTIRQRAVEWNISPNKIGIMGFSAGGHLASTAGTHFDKSYIPDDEHISLRPDFLILVYPVISMTDELTHIGSRNALLGKNPRAELINLFSNELQVRENTPPTWLIHMGDDATVPVENSIRFYQALFRNKVPAEMHLYPKGGHGFANRLTPDEWMQPLFDWMKKLQ
jgi:acetyl esterase/lipase